jgi:hypothetical protein
MSDDDRPEWYSAAIPKDLTDEAQLREWVTAVLSQLSPNPAVRAEARSTLRRFGTATGPRLPRAPYRIREHGGEVPAPLHCGSEERGHGVHHMQGTKSTPDPKLGAGRASVASDGTITINLDDGPTLTRWNHDPVRLAALLIQHQGRVVVRTLGVIGVPHADGSVSCISTSDEASACPSGDPAEAVVIALADLDGHPLPGRASQ